MRLSSRPSKLPTPLTQRDVALPSVQRRTISFTGIKLDLEPALLVTKRPANRRTCDYRAFAKR